MKYIVITIVAVLTFCACQKEDALTNELDFSNIFEITDNPDDAVQHARFEIYDQYKVSVYFNDTVGRQLIRNDINGNPYYRYETLDMAWTFFDENDAENNVTYKYFYIKDEERQLKVLERLSGYLENLNEKMRPAIMMVVDSAYLVRADGVVSSAMGDMEILETGMVAGRNADFRSNFRYTLVTSLADIDDSATENLFLEITQSLALSKIVNFTDKLGDFENITPDWYDQEGYFSYPTDAMMENQYVGESFEYLFAYYGTQYLDYGRPDSFFEVGYDERILGLGFPSSFVEDSRMVYASILGPWGFVMPASTTSGVTMQDTPNTVEDDISAFTQLALMYSPEEVEYYWGGYPLVMQKYNIIRDIIENDMGIEL